MKQRIIFLTPLLVMVTLTACGTQALTADTLPWVSQEPVLFRDDFSQQTGGWRTFEDRLSFAGYAHNAFRLWVDPPNFQVLSVPGLNFKDTHTYTRAQKSAGPDDNLFGLLCRYSNDDNYYAFVISSDGYYGIYKKQAGSLHLLGIPQMGFDESIQRGDEANEILAVCQGNQLALFVNDIKLLQVTDDTFSHGDVGLIAGNRSQRGTDVLFDYFIVVRP
jgi:hypothetical protein